LTVIFVALLFISPIFGSPYNLTIVTEQMATIAIMATGQTLVIISGAFDVSQAAVTGLTAMVTTLMAVNVGLNPFLAIGIGLGTGALAGAVNGILAARFKLHPIIMTLATAVVFTSVTYVVSHGVPVLNLPAPLLWMGGSFIGPIPVSVVIMLLVVAAMQVLLTRTRFGLRVRQVGGNVDAARLTGVNVAAITLGVFVISGLLSAFGALIEVGRVGAGIPTIGSTLLFPIITSSILGGTLLSGGEGSMVGTLFGAALLTIINNALVILQVDPYAQGVAQGGLVVAALIIDQFRRRQLTLRDLIRPEL
jgi:ribose transport system permease protein